MGFEGFYSIVMVVLMFFSTGGGKGIDLLDAISSDSYWQAKNVNPTLEQLERDAGADKPPENIQQLLKNLESEDFSVRDKAKKDLELMGPAAIEQLKPAMSSKDPEVAAVTSAMVKRFTERAEERSIRRLMAIRTLGERTEQAAVPLLKTLVDSREVFVSDYALRAIGQIEGHPVEAVNHDKEFASDVQMLSSETGVIGQMIGRGTETLSLEGLVNDAVDAMKGVGMPPMVAGQEGQVDKKKMLKNVTQKVLQLVECTGNLRIDGATVGVSKDVGPNGGSAVIIVRGKYKPAALVAALNMMHSSGPAATAPAAAAQADLLRYDADEDATFLFPSTDVMIIAAASKGADRDAAVAAVLGSLKNGKGTIAENAEISALARGVKKEGPVWMAAILPEAVKKEKPFEGIDTVTLESIRGKDVTPFTFKATGSDADKIKATAELMNTEIQSAVMMIKQQAQQQKIFEPVVDFMSSMKATAEGTTGTLTGEIKPSVRQTLLAEMGMGAMLMLSREEEANGALEGAGGDVGR